MKFKVINTEVRADKRGNSYKNVKFQTPNKISVTNEFGEKEIILVPAKISSFNAYEESYLNQKPQYGWDAEVGMTIIGSLVTKEVKPYEIDGREVTSSTVFIPGVEEDKLTPSIIAQAFKSKNLTLVDTSVTVDARASLEALNA